MTGRVATKVQQTHGRVVKVSDIDEDTRTQMLQLMSRYFEAIDEATFDSDLSAKDEVILVLVGQRVVGFSTVQVSRENLMGEPVTVLFSGDTIVDVEHWGSPVLQKNFIAYAINLMQTEDRPVYWFLLCSGYRTYRYLPLFFREFWPRHTAETPERIQTIMTELATTRYGNKYRDGVVSDLNGRLRDGISPIDEERLGNAHIAHFRKVNPGHARGDELVCLARIEPANLTRAVSRVAGDLG